VRERIAKGLVDKGVLRTEKKSFVIFDMATHPLTDSVVKRKLIQKVSDALLSRNTQPDKRTIALICATYAANLLDNVLVHMNGDQKEAAYTKADDILKENSNLTDQAKNSGITEVAAG
jgi:Golgi phosphoprotein 3